MTSARRLLVAALVSALVVVACGVDDGDVAALADLPGVDDARSSCAVGDCLLTVSTSREITAGQLGDVLREARDIGASDSRIGVDDVTVSFGADYDGSTDAGAVALAVEAREQSQVASLRIDLQRDGASVDAQIDGSREDLTTTARSMWDALDGVPDRTLSATSRSGGGGGGNRFSADGSFPAASVAFVRDFEAADLLTGVAIEDDRVLLGVSSPDIARRVEVAAAADARAVGLDVDVVLAADIVQYRADDDGGAQQGQVRAMVLALEAVDGPFVSVDGTTVRVSAEVEAMGDLAAAITTIRRDQPDVGRTVPVTVVVGTEATIELGTTGSPALLDLADRVLALDGVTEMTLSTRRADRSPPPPPGDTDSFVAVTRSSGDLDASVSALSTVFAGWDSSVSALSVSVTAVDPEGREPSVSLRIDRREDVWVPSTLERGTPEDVAAGIRAWRAGGR